MSRKGHPMGAMTVSVADAIRATSLSRATIYRMIDAGQIDTIKIGGRRLVKVASLKRLVGEDSAAEAQ